MKEIAQTRRRGVSAWDSHLIKRAALQSFPKLDPRQMVKNPVMFVVEVGSVLTTLVLIQGVFGSIASRLPVAFYNPQRAYSLDIVSTDGPGTLQRVREAFTERDIRYRLLEYDARAKKDGLVKMQLAVEAGAHLTTEDLTLLVFRDGVQSVSWDEEG